MKKYGERRDLNPSCGAFHNCSPVQRESIVLGPDHTLNWGVWRSVHCLQTTTCTGNDRVTFEHVIFEKFAFIHCTRRLHFPTNFLDQKLQKNISYFKKSCMSKKNKSGREEVWIHLGTLFTTNHRYRWKAQCPGCLSVGKCEIFRFSSPPHAREEDNFASFFAKKFVAQWGTSCDFSIDSNECFFVWW